jgi:uncharacterized coiled-coil DUF342 family protein
MSLCGKQIKNLVPLISHVWKGDTHFSSFKDLNRKLTRLTSALRQWSATSFDAVRRELRNLRKKLESLRTNSRRMGPSEEENEIEGKIVMLNLQEEIMWKQRSRIQWLNEGDNNTKFFHQKASRRRNKNRITQLSQEDGTICKEIKVLKNPPCLAPPYKLKHRWLL